jgi:L-malate glycosyltransferase
VKPIRVLFVRNGRGITDVTGAESYVFALMQAFHPARVQCLLAAVRRPAQTEAPWLMELRRRDLPHEEIELDSRFSLRDVVHVRRLARRFGADVVHGLDHRADYLALAAARALDRAALASFFGWTNWTADSLKGRLYAWLDRRAQRHLDALIVDSTDIAATVGKGEHAPPIVVIPNGVDTRRFDPTLSHHSFKHEWFGRDDVFVFGMVGRVHPNKGQLEFVRMAHKLSQRYAYVRFVIVGDAPAGFEPYKAAVTDLIRTLRLDDLVLHTNVQSASIPAVVSSFDALAAPSLQESFSFTLLESMCMARPIVATDVGGNREMMRDGVSGLLVPAGDPDSFYLACVRILEDPSLRRQLGQAAREKVLAQYGTAQMAERTNMVYREVLEWRRAGNRKRAALRVRLQQIGGLRVSEAG